MVSLIGTSATLPLQSSAASPESTRGAADPSVAGVASTATATGASATPVVSTTSTTDTVTLSSNAQRLQTAEANLAADEASSSTGALASQWNQDLANAVDSRSQASADAEVAALPSSDPDHLAQAQAAQAYVNNRIHSGADPNVISQVNNPFAGMSQTALAAIINDKSGLYTSDEKSAAIYESMDQTNAWVLKFQNDPQTQNAGFFQEAQQEYNLLSPLQQSVYPSDYLKTLKTEEGRESGTAVKADKINAETTTGGGLSQSSGASDEGSLLNITT